MTTMKDVARTAGVSIKTVSRVVNGEPGVSPDTTLAVRSAIDALGFRPNLSARTLRRGASDTVGVLVDALDDPFFAAVVQVVESRATASGLDVLVASSGGSATRATTQVNRLLGRHLAGLIAAPVGPPRGGLVLPAGLPVVTIDREPPGPTFDSVRIDDLSAGRAAVGHLLAHGHTRIAYLGESDRFSTTRDRLAAYHAELAAAGIDPDPDLVHDRCYALEDARAATHALLALPEPPTAIFAATPYVGRGVVVGLQEAGRRDVALVVFGDFPLAAYLDPPVTVVDQHPRELAQRAWALLVERMERPGGAFQDIRLTGTLTPRGSGELAPAGATPDPATHHAPRRR